MTPCTSQYIRHNGTIDRNANEIKALAVCLIKTPSCAYPAQRHNHELDQYWHQTICVAVPDKGNLCRNTNLYPKRLKALYSLGFGGIVPLCRVISGLRDQYREVTQNAKSV